MKTLLKRESVTCKGDLRDYLIYTVYDLIVLTSVCTVIQEYCRRKYCVLSSYDLK